MKFQIFPKEKSIEAATIRAIGKEEIIWVWVSKSIFICKSQITSEIVANKSLKKLQFVYYCKGQLISKDDKQTNLIKPL